MTKIDEAKKKCEKLLESARKEYEGVVQEIDAYKAKVDSAEDEMKKASDACDIKAYNAAKEKRDEAQTSLNMYQARAEKLEAEPLMDQAEYEKLCDGIQDEVNEYFIKLKDDLFDATEKMEAKQTEASDTIKEANNVLHTLQYDINRGMDLEYSPSGRIVLQGSEKSVGSRDQWSLVTWAGRATESENYQRMKKERE